MAYDIGPRITVAGEKEFNDAIKQINSTLKVLGSELKATASAFDENGASQEQLSATGKTLNAQLTAQQQKFKQLEAQYTKQKAVLAQLNTEVQKAIQEHGANSAEAAKATAAYNKQATVVDNLKVAMNESTATMNKLQQEINKNEDALRKMGAAGGTAASGINEASNAAQSGVGKMAKFEAAIQKASNTAKKMSDKLKPLSKAAAGMGAAMVATVPATQELRMDLSYLTANADRVGVSLKNQNAAFDQFNSMTGETDSSVEALSNLFESGFDNNNLEAAVNAVSGAYAQFPDTMKIEGLADGIQETLATGSAVGQFGEYLDRVGIGADNFSAQLANCTSEAEKQNLVLDALAKGGANDALKSWQDNNKELSAYNKAMGGFQKAMAGVAEALLPVITPIIEAVTKLINLFTNLPKPVQTAIVGMVGGFTLLAPALSMIGQMSNGLNVLKTVFGSAASGTTKSAGIISKVITGLKTVVVGALKGVQTVLKGLFTVIKANPVMAIITIVIGGVTLLYSKCEWFRNAVNSIITKIKGYWDSFKNKVSSVVNSIKSFFTNLVSGVKTKASQIKNAIVNGINSAVSFIISLPGKAWEWGKDFIGGFIKGITSKISGLIDKIKGIGSKIRSFLHFSRPDEGPLRDYETWMPDMMKGMAKSLTSSEGYLLNPIEQLAGRMSEGIKSALDPNGKLMTGVTATAVTEGIVIQPIIYLGDKQLSAELTGQVIKKMGTSTKGIERSKGRV